MDGTIWTIDREIIADALATATTPTLLRGETIDLPFRFFRGGPGSRASRSTHIERYESMLPYIEYASDRSIRTGTTYEGVPWFRERLPDRAGVESLVIPLEAQSADAPSIWGALVGGEDTSTPPGDTRSVTLSIFVLAPLSDYPDRAAITNDLGDDVFLA